MVARVKPRKWGFLLMQGQGDPLKLEYDGKSAANVARRQLLQNPSAYAVPTTLLLGAFEFALKAAFNSGAENKPNPVSAGSWA